jgi:hypothetical protein
MHAEKIVNLILDMYFNLVDHLFPREMIIFYLHDKV